MNVILGKPDLPTAIGALIGRIIAFCLKCLVGGYLVHVGWDWVKQ